MSAVERRNTELTIRDDQQAWTPKQEAALRQLGIEGANNADLAVFFHQVVKTGLDPFARQIYMIERKQWNPRTRTSDSKWTIQTGIDGFRLVARRAVDRARETLEYEDTLWCGPDGQWVDVWLDDSQAPVASKVTVLRNGKRFPAVARFAEYAAFKDEYEGDRKTGRKVLSGQWPSKPSVMIAKCAEALALRKAFPQDLSGLYTAEEMEQADNPPDLREEDIVQATLEPDLRTKPMWTTLAGDATTLEELTDIWKRSNAAGQLDEKLATLITLRGAQIKAAAAQGEPVPDDGIVEAEVVDDQLFPIS